MFHEEKKPQAANKQFLYVNQWGQYGQVLSTLIPNIKGKSILELFAMLGNHPFKIKLISLILRALKEKETEIKAEDLRIPMGRCLLYRLKANPKLKVSAELAAAMKEDPENFPKENLARYKLEAALASLLEKTQCEGVYIRHKNYLGYFNKPDYQIVEIKLSEKQLKDFDSKIPLRAAEPDDTYAPSKNTAGKGRKPYRWLSLNELKIIATEFGHAHEEENLIDFSYITTEILRKTCILIENYNFYCGDRKEIEQTITNLISDLEEHLDAVLNAAFKASFAENLLARYSAQETRQIEGNSFEPKTLPDLAQNLTEQSILELFALIDHNPRARYLKAIVVYCLEKKDKKALTAENFALLTSSTADLIAFSQIALEILRKTRILIFEYQFLSSSIDEILMPEYRFDFAAASQAEKKIEIQNLINILSNIKKTPCFSLKALIVQKWASLLFNHEIAEKIPNEIVVKKSQQEQRAQAKCYDEEVSLQDAIIGSIAEGKKELDVGLRQAYSGSISELPEKTVNNLISSYKNLDSTNNIADLTKYGIILSLVKHRAIADVIALVNHAPAEVTAILFDLANCAEGFAKFLHEHRFEISLARLADFFHKYPILLQSIAAKEFLCEEINGFSLWGEFLKLSTNANSIEATLALFLFDEEKKLRPWIDKKFIIKSCGYQVKVNAKMKEAKKPPLILYLFIKCPALAYKFFLQKPELIQTINPSLFYEKFYYAKQEVSIFNLLIDKMALSANKNDYQNLFFLIFSHHQALIQQISYEQLCEEKPKLSGQKEQDLTCNLFGGLISLAKPQACNLLVGIFAAQPDLLRCLTVDDLTREQLLNLDSGKSKKFTIYEYLYQAENKKLLFLFETQRLDLLQKCEAKLSVQEMQAELAAFNQINYSDHSPSETNRSCSYS